LTAVLFGLMPAWQASRGDLALPMKTAIGGSPKGLGGSAVRNGLLVGGGGPALVLLVSAGVVFKSPVRPSQTDLGFRSDHLLTFRLELPGESYPPERSQSFVEQFLAQLKARSDVEAVAFGHCAPITGRCNGTRAYFPGRPPLASGSTPLVG